MTPNVEDDPWAAANAAVRELLTLNLLGADDGETTKVRLAGDPPEFIEVPKVPHEIIHEAMQVPSPQLFAVAQGLLERAVILLAESDPGERPVSFWLEELLRPEPEQQ